MSENITKIISQSKLLLVEGYDDENFFNALLKHLNIENVQIWNAKTVTNYKNEIQTIFSLSGFSSVEQFIITRDADSPCEKNAFESIKHMALRYF